MQRLCKECGRIYRGLVCQGCHPRRRVGEAVNRGDEVGARTDTDGQGRARTVGQGAQEGFEGRESGVVGFSQRDERWAGERLGTGELTIGQAGCLISAVASMLASWGVATDPHRLNEFAKRTFGYVDGNLFVFAAVDGLGCRFVESVVCQTTPAPVGRLAVAVARGDGVVACVDATPGGMVQRHWVWVLELTESGGRIMDPWQWPGEELVDLGRYLAKGWDPARGIFAAAVYERLTGRTATAWRCDVEARQEGVCVRRGN